MWIILVEAETLLTVVNIEIKERANINILRNEHLHGRHKKRYWFVKNSFPTRDVDRCPTIVK